MIKAGPQRLFHATSDFAGAGGIGQITFQFLQRDEADNLHLGGRAMGEGESVGQ